MKALPLEQAQLVQLQQLDLAIARLQHQEKTHPALQTLAQLQSRAQDLRGAIIATEAEIDRVAREIQAMEEESEKVKERRALQVGRLESGKVPMRDMSAMEHEIASMDTRIDSLDDRIVEAMEESEKLQGAVEGAQGNATAIEEKELQLKSELGEDLAATGEEIAALRQERRRLEESLPGPVLAEYSSLQKRLGPRVVLEMRDGALIDAPVELPIAELSEVSTFPANQLYISEETEYLVARTSAK